MKKLIINYITREKRFALLNGQKVEKLVIQQPKQLSMVGNIYIGIVTKVLPGMNAAFIDIGEGKNGFIHRDKLVNYVLSSEPKEQKEKKSISSFVHQGEKIMVQVEKDATGTKGPRLTAIIEISGDHIVYMPIGKYIAISKKIEKEEVREEWRQFGYKIKAEEEGIIFRTSCTSSTQQELQIELENARKRYLALEQQAKTMKKAGMVYEQDLFLKEIMEVIKPISETVEVMVDDRILLEEIGREFPSLAVSLYNDKENIFTSYRLDSEMDKALKRVVWLDNGAYLVLDEVEALTIMDVNTGKFSGKNNLKDTVLKTNLLAAEEAARQIQLRNLAGMILIDFIDMRSDEERQQVMRKMVDELQKDDRQTKIIGFTPLGIFQLTRKKTKVSLSESLMDKCPVCEGTGRTPSTETVAFRLERELYEYRFRDNEVITIDTTEEVKIVFCGDQNIHKKRLEEVLGFKIEFQVTKKEVPFYHISQIH